MARTKTKPVRAKRVLLIISVIIASIFVGGMFGVITAYFRSAPTLEDIHLNQPFTTQIFDVNGKLITSLYRENRVPVKIDQLPDHLKNAIVAIEDDRFYDHHGINFIAFGRAIWVNLRELRFAQGGGTITMQLARNLHLTQDKTIMRKLDEFLWAVQFERKYVKDEILESYVNMVHLGHGANGVEAGSQLYLGKPAADLTLSEAALIAGVIRWPGRYSPYVNPDVAVDRRDFVLSRMVDTGFITEAEAEAAKAEPINLAERQPRVNNAPYFVDHILEHLIDTYGEEEVFTGGLQIYTTLDLDMQNAAEKALLEGIPSRGKDGAGLNQPQAALISMDPSNGHIRAMVGGRGEDKFNRATQARRSPGSAIKIFGYTAAIDNGITPGTVYMDEPIEIPLPAGGHYSPRNYSGEFAGALTVREALEKSTNTIATTIVHEMGYTTVMDYGKRMGISSFVEQGRENDLGPASLALGGLTNGVSPMEMVSAYAVLANQGIKVDPISIIKVVDVHGTILENNTPRKQVVLSEQTSYIMTDMLRGAIEQGSGRNANIGRPAAGKTGTHQDYRDAWFVGYTPELATAVWFGEDRPARMVYNGIQYGSWNAASIWGNYTSTALRNTPIRDFPKPSGLVDDVMIDIKTGLLVRDDCSLPKDEVRSEIFIKGTEPTQYSPRCERSWWQSLPFFQQPAN